MEKYFWWTDEEKRFADEVEEFSRENAHRMAEEIWTGDVPQDVLEEVRKRGWDVKKGIPTKEKLLDLGLKSVAEDLERLGVF